MVIDYKEFILFIEVPQQSQQTQQTTEKVKEEVPPGVYFYCIVIMF